MGHELPMPVDRIEATCRKHSLEHLIDLRTRMSAFYRRESQNRKDIKQEISEINLQITGLQTQLVLNRQEITEIESLNESIRSNLPGNGAERYLALQHLSNVPPFMVHLAEEIKALETTQVELSNKVRWINYEFTIGDVEFPAVLRIIEEKKLAMSDAIAPASSMRI
jgi:chromosome segregation ATPase